MNKPSETRLIVGLGNPGQDYEYTRHNLGFLVVHRLAHKMGMVFSKSSFTNGLMAQNKQADATLFCLLPMTFMNNSGLAVNPTVEKLGLNLDQVLIVCDDFNLNFGQIRLRSKGSDGGHNGLTSIFECLGTQHVTRLRLGIDAPRVVNSQGIINYVLGEFTKKERDVLDGFIDRAVNCCEFWIKEGISKAMDQFNGTS